MWDPDTDFAKPSFWAPIPDPGTEPDAAPLVCVSLNLAWRPLLAGAALQLCQPPTWDVATADEVNDLLARATILVNRIGMATECLTMQVRFSDCTLEISYDSGATWTAVAGWVDGFGACVRGNQALVIMTPLVNSPPVPVWTPDGTDWVYSP